MVKRFSRPICDFGKWHGLYLEILSDSRGSVWNIVDYDWILQKGKVLFIRWWGFSWFRFIFQWKIAWTESVAHGARGTADPSRTKDRARRGAHRSLASRPLQDMAALRDRGKTDWRRRRCSLAVEGGDRGVELVG
jgi:hypothetical protein